MTDFDINRRRLLGAIGGTGIAAFAGLGYATDDAVRYTMASSHSCENYTLDAEWRETYTRDGETTLLENTTATSDDETGEERTDSDEPAPENIHLQNVLPGDRGTVSFKLTADREDDTADDNVTPTLGLDLTGTAENGINDPEREAGDQSPDAGELQEYLDVKIWKDTGILGFNTLGGNNLENDPLGEPTIAEGTLENVAGDLDGDDLGTIDATTDESVSVTLRWEFTDESGINVTQTDSVTFTLDISCE
jgi:hypothetical protein